MLLIIGGIAGGALAVIPLLLLWIFFPFLRALGILVAVSALLLWYVCATRTAALRAEDEAKRAAQELELSRPKTEKDVLHEYYQQLPPRLKDFMFSVGASDIIWSVGEKRGVSVEGIGLMAEECGRVTLGLTSPAEFSSNLTHLLKITPNEARGITEDLHRRLFSRYQQDLHETHGYYYDREALLA